MGYERRKWNAKNNACRERAQEKWFLQVSINFFVSKYREHVVNVVS